MENAFKVTVGDAIDVEIQLTDSSGVVVPLGGATSVSLGLSRAGFTVHKTLAATVSDAPNGLVTVAIAANAFTALDTGTWDAQVHVGFAGGPRSYPSGSYLPFHVFARAGG